MKKIILLYLMFMPFIVAFGQTFHETEIGSSTIQGKKVLVRNYNDTVTVMYNYDFDLSDGENRFTVWKTSSSQCVSFKLPDIYTLGGTPFPTPPYNNGGKILYRIHDMQIYGDTCYFCGEKRETTGNYHYDTTGNLTYETDDIGLVGKFTINKLLAGINDLELVTLSKVVSLQRMTVYDASQGYSISMIGIPKGVSSPSCIVDLYSEVSMGTWVYDVAYPSDNREILSDITYSGGALVTVSKMVYDNYAFLLRCTKASWILTDPYTCINTPHVFHTNASTTYSYPYVLPTERDYMAPLFLCPEEKESPVFYVAHECLGPHYGVAAYRMVVDDFCSPILNLENQFIMYPQYQTKLKDIASCTNTNTLNTLYLLTENAANSTPTVQLATFPSTSDYQDYKYYQTDYDILSLDITNNSKLLYGGSNNLTDNIFQTITAPFHYNPSSAPTFLLCRSFSLSAIFILRPLVTGYKGEELIIFINHEPVQWNPTEITPKTLDNTSICILS